MSTYTDHTDRVNLDARLRVLTSHAERARMLALEAEKEFGSITLFMSKHELMARRGEGWYLSFGVQVDHAHAMRAVQNSSRKEIAP